MKIIGITGGVGAGKSQILKYLEQAYPARIIMADNVAHKVKEKGQSCYEPLIDLLGKEVLEKNGEINKQKMAAEIFADKELLFKVNQLIHPAVKAYIRNEIEFERKKGAVKFLFIEAALLIEDHYDEICDELWYIYAEESVRAERLMKTRGYSLEKIEQIMNGQLGDKEFRESCQFVINNSRGLKETFDQIDRKLGEYL